MVVLLMVSQARVDAGIPLLAQRWAQWSSALSRLALPWLTASVRTMSPYSLRGGSALFWGRLEFCDGGLPLVVHMSFAAVAHAGGMVGGFVVRVVFVQLETQDLHRACCILLQLGIFWGFL